MKNITLATVNTQNEKCVNWSRAIAIYQNQKIEFLAFQELVNHFCLGEGDCLHPFDQNSDQNKVYRIFFRRKFLKTGVVIL